MSPFFAPDVLTREKRSLDAEMAANDEDSEPAAASSRA